MCENAITKDLYTKYLEQTFLSADDTKLLMANVRLFNEETYFPIFMLKEVHV